jgi:hypothetical protein
MKNFILGLVAFATAAYATEPEEGGLEPNFDLFRMPSMAFVSAKAI